MGLFSRSSRTPATQPVTPVELALALTAIAGGRFDAHVASAVQLRYDVVRLELFVLSSFATAWNASRHRLVAGLTAAQRRVVTDAYGVFTYCLWNAGRKGLSAHLPKKLDWAHYVTFRNTVDFRQYPPFTELVRDRSAEYAPLAGAAVSASDQAIAVQLGDAAARHVFGHQSIGPMQSLWCGQLFQEITAAVSGSMDHYRYVPDRAAEASAAAAGRSPDTVIVACPRCGQKNRVPAARRREALCGRCRSPL
jgi:hypothetical protein